MQQHNIDRKLFKKITKKVNPTKIQTAQKH
jgi:hypothetical protein